MAGKVKRTKRAQVTYVVWMDDKTGPFRVTVPADWRVTRGAARPGLSGGDSLRFYQGTKQRACMPGVKRFCDDSIKWEIATELAALEKLTGQPSTLPLL